MVKDSSPTRVFLAPQIWPRLAMTVLLAWGLVWLLTLAVNLSHTLDEVHGYWQYIDYSWAHLLTSGREPGNHLLHNIFLKLAYPLFAHTPVSLRWLTIVWSLGFLALFGVLVTNRIGRYREPAAPPAGVLAVLVPLAFSFFQFYAVLNRGYMLGLLCFALFILASENFSWPPARKKPWWWALVMTLAAFGSGAAVLSNALWILGGGGGYLILDGIRGKFKQLGIRALLLGGSAISLLWFHPVLHPLGNVAHFTSAYGRKFETVHGFLYILKTYLLDYMQPFPWLTGVFFLLGLIWLIRTKNSLLFIFLCSVTAPLAWVLFSRNAMFLRSYFNAYLGLLFITSAGVVFFMDYAQAKLARLKSALGYLPTAAMLGLLLIATCRAQALVASKHPEWGVAINTKQWIKAEPPYSLAILPWDIFQPYMWDLGTAGQQRFQKMAEAKRIDQVQILFRPRKQALSFRAADNTKITRPLDLKNRPSQPWSRSYHSLTLKAETEANIWQQGQWLRGQPNFGPDSLFVVLLQAPFGRAFDLAGLPVTGDLLHYAGHRQPADYWRAYLVLEVEALPDVLHRLDGRGDQLLVAEFTLAPNHH